MQSITSPVKACSSSLPEDNSIRDIFKQNIPTLLIYFFSVLHNSSHYQAYTKQ